MLVPNKMQHILCTGNIGSKREHEKLRELAPNVHVVGGDYEYNPTLANSAAASGGPYGTTTTSSVGNTTMKYSTLTATPVFADTKVIQVGEFRIGIINGYQIIPHNHMTLASMRRKLDVDILITGHTHKHEVVKHEDFWHINPVSLVFTCLFQLGLWNTCSAWYFSYHIHPFFLFPESETKGLNNRRIFIFCRARQCSILYTFGRSRV
jgi:putative phosphoesterase